MNFTPVQQRHKRVAIVGSGPSATPLSAINIPSDVTIIAVNGAVEWLPRCDYWFTLDPDLKNYNRMIRQRLGVYYFAAVPAGYGTPHAKIPVWRNPPPNNIHYLHRKTGTGVLSSLSGLSDNPTEINTGNSAYGALGLARHFQAEKVALFGIDANRRRRIEGGRPGEFVHLPGLFASALQDLRENGIKVINGSSLSRVTCFPRIDVQGAVKWLTE